MARDGDHPRAERGGFRHAMVAYGSDHELARLVGPFMEFGAAQEEPVVCVASAASAAVLARAAGDAESAIRFVEQADWYRSPNHALDDMCDLVDDRQRVRVIAEPPARAGWWLEAQEWQRLDSLSNAVAADLPITTVCLYDARQVGMATLQQALRTHPQVLTSNGPQRSEDYIDPADFAAECDRHELVAPASSLQHTIATPGELGTSRAEVREVARRYGVAAHRAGDLAMAVSEIVSNALEHGGGVAKQRAWDEGHGLICEVFDPGPGFDDPFAGYREPPALNSRGRGLRMARQLCDLMRIRSTPAGTTVWLYLHY